MALTLASLGTQAGTDFSIVVWAEVFLSVYEEHPQTTRAGALLQRPQIRPQGQVFVPRKMPIFAYVYRASASYKLLFLLKYLLSLGEVSYSVRLAVIAVNVGCGLSSLEF
jgi:hypothetical protein